MGFESGRYKAAMPAQVAEGWTLVRATPPSRLASANGLRTGLDGRIYVAQVAGSAVSAIDPDSGAIEVVSPMGGAIIGPDDLAFDEAGNLYCTEITEGRVSMLAPDGTSRVIQGDMPVANPITYHQGRLIAGECRVGARIMELDRGGGAPRIILDNVPMVNAFEVGPDGKLYFPVMGTNEIWRVSLDGGEPEVVARNLGVPDSVKFHPDGSIISTQVHSGQVLRIDPLTGESSLLADIGPGLDNVTFVGKRIFVSHITGSIHEILAPGKVRALIDKGLQWPLGLTVAADGTLFIADGGFTYLLAPGAAPVIAGMLFTPGFPGWTRDAVASAPGEFVVTTAANIVARWRPASQEHEVLASGIELAMGIDKAPGGGIVFAEAAQGRVMAVAGGDIETLARGLDEPRGVAVGSDGTVYVAESGAGRVVKIARGKVETAIDGLGEPHGIAIDGNRLYVVDIKGRRLEDIDLASGARQTIATELPVGAAPGTLRKYLGAVGDMCGPMVSFTGLAIAPDGTIYVSADAEGSVLAFRRAR
ncbi:MAG: gluconolaconase [Sphingomonadales bacterium]|nr:gluconolaconase [Sphingomonadales bacterium]